VAVHHIVGRDPMSLDTHGVARAAIESLAENFSDGVIASVFWLLLLGLPGLYAYKMANTLDSMIGHRAARYRSFGWAAARLDDVLNLVPAPISGLLLVAAAAFDQNARSDRALAIMLRDARKHHSPNAGWPESAMAGALGLALALPLALPVWTISRSRSSVLVARILRAKPGPGLRRTAPAPCRHSTAERCHPEFARGRPRRSHRGLSQRWL
jgi:adenosylcobinamide-phosphate synthase